MAIEKVSATEISIPVPARKVSLSDLKKVKTALEERLSVINSQIDEAERLGVVEKASTGDIL